MTDTPEPRKDRGTVPMPEAGEYAHLHYSFAAAEKIQADGAGDYLADLFDGLRRQDVKTIRVVLAATLVNGDPDGAPWNLPIETLAKRLADAVSLGAYGRTRDEQDDTERAEAEALIEKAKSNPFLALRLHAALRLPRVVEDVKATTRADLEAARQEVRNA